MQNSKNDPLDHESYDPVYFEHLAAVEDEHFWFLTRNHVIQTLTQQITEKFSPGYRVLEIGCGTGNVLRELNSTCRQGLVIGSDLFLGGLKFAKDRVAGPLIQSDLNALPFSAGFDLVGMFDVIEHIPNDEEVFETLNRFIAPGGYLFLTVPAHPSLWSYFDEGARHCRRYLRPELVKKLQSAGFEIEFTTYYMALIFPLIWFVRKLNKLASRKKSLTIEEITELTMAEFKIVPVVNPILSWLLSFENWIISRRKTLPFGVSLLVLAHRPTR